MTNGAVTNKRSTLRIAITELLKIEKNQAKRMTKTQQIVCQCQ